MYSTPKSFLKDIKHIDRNLDCQYSPRCERFIVTYKRAYGDEVPVFIVGDPDPNNPDGFRFPDRRDIEKIHECDFHRETAEEKWQRLSKLVWDQQQKQLEKQQDMIRQRTLEDRVQLVHAFQRFLGAGKGNSAFRRIKIKQKGVKFD